MKTADNARKFIQTIMTKEGEALDPSLLEVMMKITKGQPLLV